MPARIWACLAVLVLSGCSSAKDTSKESSKDSKESPRASAGKGRVVVALTIDWEGAYLSTEGLEALDELRKGLGPVPLTHFVSAAYFTKAEPDTTVTSTIQR